MPPQRHKTERHLPVLQDAGVEALLPQLVEAPALRAAGPGRGGAAEAQGLRPLVDVAQGQVGKAAGGDVLPRHGAIDRLLTKFPVEDADVDEAILRGGEAPEEPRLLGGRGEGRPVDHGSQRPQGDAFHLGRPEDMDVPRPVPGVGALRPEGIVVARREENRHRHLRQGLLHGLHRFGVGLSVKEIAGEQHEIRLPGPNGLRQSPHELPLLPPALRRLLRRQGGKGAVQVEVRRVDEFQHRIPPQFCSSGRQPLQTSTQAVKPLEQRSSSSQLISMALLALPAAGKTVANRRREISR